MSVRFFQEGEFLSKEFKELCENNGIDRPLTIPRTQQNRVLKQKNKVILHMSRNMLKSKKMPKEFQVKAIANFMYFSNCSPSRSVWEKTAQEAQSGRKSGISHLTIFGGIAYIHVRKGKRTKLDDRRENLIFIGYDTIPKTISFIIQQLTRLSLVETQILMKNACGTRIPKMMIITLCFYLKKKKIQEENIEMKITSHTYSNSLNNTTQKLIFFKWKLK